MGPLQKLKEFLNGLLPVQRVALVSVALVALVLPALLTLASGTVRYCVVLKGNHDSEEISKIVREFEKVSIEYRLCPRGQVLSVPEDQVAEAWDIIRKIQSNQSAAPESHPFKDGGFLSPELQKLQQHRTLERDLARTFQLYSFVNFAKVHITPGTQGFYRGDVRQAKASIFLELNRQKKLAPDQVQIFVELTASAVENLRPENITLCDNLGNKYSGIPKVDKVSQITTVTVQVEEILNRKIQDCLARVLPPGSFSVTVHLDLVLKSTGKKKVVEEAPEPGRSGLRPCPTFELASVASLSATPGLNSLLKEFCEGVTRIRETAPKVSEPVPAPDAPNPDPLLTEVGATEYQIVRMSLSIMLNSALLSPGSLSQGAIRSLESHIKVVSRFDERRGDSCVVLSAPFFLRAAAAANSTGIPKSLSEKILTMVSQNFNCYWMVQVGLLLAILIYLVRNSADYMGDSPMTRAPGEDRGVFRRLSNRVSSMAPRNLEEALRPLDAQVLARALRLLEDREKNKILTSLSPSGRLQVEHQILDPRGTPLRLMEESCRQLLELLEEADRGSQSSRPIV